MSSRDFKSGVMKLVSRGARVQYWLNSHAEIVGIRVRGIAGIPSHRMSADALIPHLI